MDRFLTMKAFLAVAQEGSFTGAAKRLNMSTKLVSKYVAHLESRMAVQLFTRTTRQVTLTDIGEAYRPQAMAIVDQVEDLEARLLDQQGTLSGKIKLTAPTAFGSTRLVDCLVPFQQAHSEVELDLVLSDHRVALVEEGFDLAIRIGTLRDSSLVASKLADMPILVCASPDYIARHGTPETPADLSRHACLINSGHDNPGTWSFRQNDKESLVKVSGPFTANAPKANARMAEGGLGIARCPLYILEESIRQGRLVPLLPDYQVQVFGVYALYPQNRHLTRRVRVLIDTLKTELRRHAQT